MVPAAFVSLAAIPLNTSGKVDRRALGRMDVAVASGREYVPPRNATEEQLVAMWAEVLKLPPEKVGVLDNFFELGGHSLSSVQLISRINDRFKRSLPFQVIFTSADIAAFAELLSSEETGSREILIPIQPSGDAPPIFGIPGAGGMVLSLQPLARALGTKQPFYGLEHVGLDGTTSPLASVEQTAQANIAAVRKVQARGPYRFIGHSYGGVVAYEMARILLEQGEEIASLTLLDSVAPWVVQAEPPQDEAAELSEIYAAIANMTGANVELDSDRLRQSEEEENVRYLVGLLNDNGHEFHEGQITTFREVYRANLRCYRRYKPSMLPRDYGWNRLLQSPIRVYDVDGDHSSMLNKVQFLEAGSQILQFVG